MWPVLRPVWLISFRLRQFFQYAARHRGALHGQDNGLGALELFDQGRFVAGATKRMWIGLTVKDLS